MSKPTFQETIEKLTVRLSEKIEFITTEKEKAIKAGRSESDVSDLDTLFDVGVFYAHTLLAIAKAKASGELDKDGIPSIIEAFNTIGDYINIVNDLENKKEKSAYE